MSDLLKELYSDALETRRSLSRLDQSESGTIKLLRINTSTAQLIELKEVFACWDMQRVSDGLGGQIEVFKIAEGEITSTEAKQIHSVEYGGNRYRVNQKTAPNAMRRYWLLKIQTTEAA